jgi:glycolate dehydrogenase FAD-binding subunit
LATAVDAIRAEFAGIVGKARVVCEEATCASAGIDGKVPRYIVYPTSAGQVAEAVKCAAENDLAVVACGGASKLDIGNPPRKYDVALCLRDMEKIEHYEPADLTAGVEAGMKFQEFQRLVERDGLWLPLDPPGAERATLGGLVATNASGPLRHLYGAPRDMVLGMRIATADGKLIKTGGRVVKNVAGYDLGKLMIGSFGSLGVIVEVNVKLYPLPAARETFILKTGTLGIARDMRRSILNLPLDPARVVLVDAEAAKIVHPVAGLSAQVREPEIWVEMIGSRAVIERARKELAELGRAVGFTVQSYEGESIQAAWQFIADFGQSFRRSYPESVVLKGTLPIAHTEEFLSLAQQEAENARMTMMSVSQVGVGLIQLGLAGSKGTKEMVAVVGRLRTSVEKLGGGLMALAAPADFKAEIDVWGMPQNGFKVMQKLKAAWDPKGIFAPGRFAGGL